MSGISIMELNAKSPFLWDWENLVMFNTKPVEPSTKKLHLVDSEIEGIEGYDVGSSYFSGGRSDGGVTGSDLGYASSSRSSKSASVDSSSDRQVKGTKFTLGTNDCLFTQDLRNKKEMAVNNSGLARTSSTIESSVASGESLIALELGKRTYFEDVTAVSVAKNSSLSPRPPDSVAKKSKSSAAGNTEVPRCQVEGCNLDLSDAKDYHRKHRVCENHSKCPKVVINGLEKRFCQQCSRFHSLSEFDQKKRSCRRRLSDHNARRRKPKPEVIRFNTMRLTSSLYDGGNQLSFALNQGSSLQTGHGSWDSSINSTKHAWDSTSNSKGVPAKPSLFTTMKTGVADELHMTRNGSENKLSTVSSSFLPSRGTPPQVFQQGQAVSMAPSNLDATQDPRALSLLSTSSWGSSCNPEPSPLDHSMHANQPPLAQPLPDMHSMSLSGPPVSEDYWQAQQPISSTPAESNASTFQLFKAPNESNFYLY